MEDLFDRPQHPYTEGLFKSVPKLGARASRLDTIPGTVPNPAKFPPGCKFHPRCHRTRQAALTAPTAQDVTEVVAGGERFNVLRTCAFHEPELKEVKPQQWAACHLVDTYSQAPLTIPKLEHRREVVAETILGDRLSPAAVVTGGGEVTR